MSVAEVTPIRPEPEALEILRKPFDPKVIGKLPRVTQKDSPKAKCNECGGFLPKHIHLDYVGHAEVTDRLLSADPAWNWEPLAWTDEGFPKFTKGSSGELELWIRLTVGGVTRLGVGSVAGNAFDAEKQLIGDALRNAAMRFGVALDLWAKEELESQLPIEEQATSKRAKPVAAAPPANVDADTGEVAPPAPKVRKPPGAMKPTTPPAMAKVEDVPQKAAPWDVPESKFPPRATDEQVADLKFALSNLVGAGDEWVQRARDAQDAAGIPRSGFSHLSEDEAAALFIVMDKVLLEAKAIVTLTLDGGEG